MLSISRCGEITCFIDPVILDGLCFEFCPLRYGGKGQPADKHSDIKNQTSKDRILLL